MIWYFKQMTLTSQLHSYNGKVHLVNTNLIRNWRWLYSYTQRLTTHPGVFKIKC